MNIFNEYTLMNKMDKVVKAQDVAYVIRFKEFKEYAKSHSDPPHWSFNFFGVSITHENDECYLIPIKSEIKRFTKMDVILIKKEEVEVIPIMDFENMEYKFISIK